jgi:hypothetical protein
MAYKENVFINCPFDEQYRRLLRPLLFTILYLHLEPKISQTSSSGTIRINQIKRFIRTSRYGIHDLSRSKPLKKGDLPRFNMPYELGLDIGCHEFGGQRFKDKKILILETDPYHYQKVLSDIAGQDIKHHADDPKTIVREVRNWFSTIDPGNVAGYSAIWIAFNQFTDDLNTSLLSDGGFTQAEVDDMPEADYIKYVKQWIDALNKS